MTPSSPWNEQYEKRILALTAERDAAILERDALRSQCETVAQRCSQARESAEKWRRMVAEEGQKAREHALRQAKMFFQNSTDEDFLHLVDQEIAAAIRKVD